MGEAAMSTCPWQIRPFPGETQVQCEKPDGHDRDPATLLHESTLRDYAWPGSETKVTWVPGDRREFSGSFPGYCTQLGSTGGRQNCTLPAEHHGRCAP